MLFNIAILASGFKVVEGHVTVKVPKVQPGNDYSLVRKCQLFLVHDWPLSYVPGAVFGDSGNFSPLFTIEQ